MECFLFLTGFMLHEIKQCNSFFWGGGGTPSMCHNTKEPETPSVWVFRLLILAILKLLLLDLPPA